MISLFIFESILHFVGVGIDKIVIEMYQEREKVLRAGGTRLAPTEAHFMWAETSNNREVF